jgi:hypothetical protein
MVNDLEIADLLKIEKLHHRDFPLPEINDPSYIIKKALLKDNQVVGASFARLTSELILILDPSLSDFSRARLWIESAGEMFRDLLRHNIKSTHVFITPENDERYAQLLERKLGFVRATGIPLYLEVK